MKLLLWWRVTSSCISKTDCKDLGGRVIVDQSFRMIVRGRSSAVVRLPSKHMIIISFVEVLGNGLLMAYTKSHMNEWCKQFLKPSPICWWRAFHHLHNAQKWKRTLFKLWHFLRQSSLHFFWIINGTKFYIWHQICQLGWTLCGALNGSIDFCCVASKTKHTQKLVL